MAHSIEGVRQRRQLMHAVVENLDGGNHNIDLWFDEDAKNYWCSADV